LQHSIKYTFATIMNYYIDNLTSADN